MEKRISIAERHGLVDQFEDLEYEKKKLSGEFERLAEVRKDLNSEESEWIKRFSEQYNCGFRRGVSERLKKSYLSSL
ncbi:MAG: hypothetical protein N2513_10550 [Deltaproteobacteria bacterium]|nr:hypothetical protein [Deltaproteobacteria bacterium]